LQFVCRLSAAHTCRVQFPVARGGFGIQRQCIHYRFHCCRVGVRTVPRHRQARPPAAHRQALSARDATGQGRRHWHCVTLGVRRRAYRPALGLRLRNASCLRAAYVCCVSSSDSSTVAMEPYICRACIPRRRKSWCTPVFRPLTCARHVCTCKQAQTADSLFHCFPM
jgi:hypothetical protein